MVNYGMIGAMILPNVGGWAGGILTSKNIKPWYEVGFVGIWNFLYYKLQLHE